MKGYFEEIKEAQRALEAVQAEAAEQQATLLAQVDTLRKERQAADAAMSLAIGLTAQETSALAEKTESLIAGVSALGEGQANAAQIEALGEAGAAAIQLAASAGADVARNIAVFSGHYPAWLADGGTEELHHISSYNGMAYICINPIQRFTHWAPDAATNNYCPYPASDVKGVFPYIPGMLVWGGMKVRGGDGNVYRCTLAEGTYKLVNEPSEAVSIFEI